MANYLAIRSRIIDEFLFLQTLNSRRRRKAQDRLYELRCPLLPCLPRLEDSSMLLVLKQGVSCDTNGDLACGSRWKWRSEEDRESEEKFMADVQVVEGAAYSYGVVCGGRCQRWERVADLRGGEIRAERWAARESGDGRSRSMVVLRDVSKGIGERYTGLGLGRVDRCGRWEGRDQGLEIDERTGK